MEQTLLPEYLLNKRTISGHKFGIPERFLTVNIAISLRRAVKIA
jgi:hypothetical protein